MARINAVGQTCPIPVVMAKKAIAELPAAGGEVEIQVDNRIACDNLGKMAQGSGHRYTMRELEDGTFLVTIAVGAGAMSAGGGKTIPELPASGEGLMVAVGSDCMGRGSDDLGAILIKGFLYSLSQLAVPPRAVAFFNGGVRLVLAESNTVEDIRVLANKGCAILVCGTCVDYYGLRDHIGVGEITNMFAIVEAMSAARHVVSV